MLTIELEGKETHVDAELVINTSLVLLHLTRINHDIGMKLIKNVQIDKYNAINTMLFRLQCYKIKSYTVNIIVWKIIVTF